MSSLASYPSTTRRLDLPLLFAGQAQKEFFVNQGLGVIDALVQHTITASLASPPPNALEGDCFRVLGTAGGAWEGKDNQLAIRLGGSWHFVVPTPGLTMYDQANGQHLHFKDEWQSASLPSQATGGTNIDAEARALLAQVIDALIKLGLVAPQPA